MSINSKKNKKLRRKFDRLLLEYKVIDADCDEILSDTQEGHNDFMFRISQFQDRIDSNQKNDYRKNILGFNDKALKVVQHEDRQLMDDCEPIQDNTKKAVEKTWQKKLLRAIAIKTHPDKLLHFPPDDKVFYTEICRVAMEAYEQEEDVKLMLTGYEVRIRPQLIRKLHLDLIEKDINMLIKKASNLKKNHGYVWYFMTDAEKEVFLTNYLSQLGYNVNPEKIKETMKIKKPTQRKPGEKPAKTLKSQRAKK